MIISADPFHFDFYWEQYTADKKTEDEMRGILVRNSRNLLTEMVVKIISYPFRCMIQWLGVLRCLFHKQKKVQQITGTIVNEHVAELEDQAQVSWRDFLEEIRELHPHCREKK